MIERRSWRRSASKRLPLLDINWFFSSLPTSNVPVKPPIKLVVGGSICNKQANFLTSDTIPYHTIPYQPFDEMEKTAAANACRPFEMALLTENLLLNLARVPRGQDLSYSISRASNTTPYHFRTPLRAYPLSKDPRPPQPPPFLQPTSSSSSQPDT